MNNLIEKFEIYGFRKFCALATIELKNKLIWQLIKKSYSQSGEDLIIDKLLNHKKNGFYIDVGAHDPHRFSNTKRFYKRGWQGINIEPDLINYKKFIKYRANDINLNIGIGNIEDSLTFYQFIPDTLSTFAKEEADKYIKQNYKLKNTFEVKVKKLANILDEYCQNKELDFMSIDTEGYDMEVLKSNSWQKYKPKIICIESTTEDNSQDLFLKNIGYQKVYDNGLNSIYKFKI